MIIDETSLRIFCTCWHVISNYVPIKLVYIYSKFQVSRADVFEGSLVMATMASEDPSDRADTSISSSINSSQSNSTFRGTEDLLGGFRSRPRTPSNANTNAVRYFMLPF